MLESNTPITLPDETIIEGTAPVVFIGPNGSGKTRFGAGIAEKSTATRIPALRSLAFARTIQPRAFAQASGETENKITRYRSEYHLQADEINEMLSELKAEHSDIATKFLDSFRTNSLPAQPPITNLDKLLNIWHQSFPGRILDFSTYDPIVTSSLGDTTINYQANTMSDGERAAIYLIARVLRAPDGIIVVDEPEVHFHSLLARSFWDTLQSEKNNCRFVYITHDLPFALSRRNAEIGIVKNSTTAEIIEKSKGIPPEIIEGILGAASLSLVAKRLVFSEGISGVSIDSEFYGAWFHSPDTTVIPVGNCRAVQEAVTVIKQKKIVSNAEPLGIIERDYLPDSYISILRAKNELFILPTHEIEGLLCFLAVAKAVAKYKGIQNQEFDTLYSEFESKVRAHFSGEILNRLITERVKQEINNLLSGLITTKNGYEEHAFIRRDIVSSIQEKFSSIDGGAIFDTEKLNTEYILTQNASQFLQILPGKDCLSILLQKLNITEEQYINLIVSALRQSEESGENSLKTLKIELVEALSPHLPAR